MGKNTKKRKGTWTPHPIDGSDPAADDDGLLAKKKKEKKKKKKQRNDDSSLRKKKATKPANSPALRQLLGDSFPRRRRSLHFDHLHNEDNDEEERFADLSDIVATDWRAEARMPAEGSDSTSVVEDDEEEMYQSRKLVMRQLVMNQLSFIRQHFNPTPEDDDQEEAPEDDERLDRDGVSDADSWQEMEERFAEIYEPIPYHVAMDSWRSMSKEQMLKTVTSRRLRSRMKYMSRAEILSQIQTLKSRHHDDQRKSQQHGKSKSPVYEDMSAAAIHPPSAKSVEPAEKQQQQKKKKKTAKPEQQQQTTNKLDTPIYQNTSSYQGLSLADIYQAKVEARRQELQQLKLQKAAGKAEAAASAGHNNYHPEQLYVTRALVHAPPGSDDEGQQKFLSRAGILSKLGTPSTAPDPRSKTDLIAQFWRQSDYITTEYSRSLGGGGQQTAKIPSTHSCSSSSPSSSCPSDCDGCCDGGEECSMCSCSSCGSDRTVRSFQKQPVVPAIIPRVVKPERRHEPEVKVSSSAGPNNEKSSKQVQQDGGGLDSPEPVPLSLVKQRKMEFERLRILEEQENRLQELVRRTRSDAGSPAHQSWLDLAQRARQLEDKWNMARRSSSSAIYEPVSPSKLLSKKEEKKGRRNNNNRSKKRSKVIQQLKSRMKENLASESLDPRVRQRRHEELKELLSDAVHAGTQTLTNINLGLIYVPMEQQHEKEPDKGVSGPPGGGLMTLKTDRSHLGSGNVAVAADLSVKNDGGASTDESEDLFGSIDTLIFEPKAGGSSTIKTDELDEVEERIAQQFDYLNDYGSCQEEDSSDDCKSTRTGNGSKNGRRAAVAAVAAASPPPNPTAGRPETGSCAAAASCDAFASKSNGTNGPSTDDDGDSLASFSSVIFQGEKLLKEEEEEERRVNEAATTAKKSTGSTLDSEHYTNVDTDASWDYYPDGDGLVVDEDRMRPGNKSNPFLAVGNLRKRPPELLPGVDETDETARLLESLRLAEDSNVSTSLRLLFPPGSLKMSAAGNNIFTDMANEALNSPVVTSLPAFADEEPLLQSADSGFRSLPELIQAKEDGPATGGPTAAPSGLRKRDTMIRELKMRLRDKFHCVGDDHSTPPPSRPAELVQTEKKKPKVVSKLESILASFNALAQMKAEGRVYRTAPPQPLSLPAEYYTNDVGYETPTTESLMAFHSTGYPHHLLLQQAAAMSISDPTIYDPSISPDEMGHHYSEIPRPMEPLDILHQQHLASGMEHYPLGLDPRLRAWYDNALFEQRMESYPHESLYDISDPLLVESSPRMRKKRRRRRPKERPESTEDEAEEIHQHHQQEPVGIDPELSWSDIENHLFADRVNDHFAGLAGLSHGAAQSRMAPYHDEWLFWDQLNNLRSSEADRQRWEEDRARRMLLWIHHSQGNCAVPGQRPPQWWQVFDS